MEAGSWRMEAEGLQDGQCVSDGSVNPFLLWESYGKKDCSGRSDLSERMVCGDDEGGAAK